MAVDIKSLRIGSHVLINRVRSRVFHLEMISSASGKSVPYGRFESNVNGHQRECGASLTSGHVQPIPITPLLLRELGYEWRKSASGRVFYTKQYDSCAHVRFFSNTPSNDVWDCIYSTRDMLTTGLLEGVRYVHEAEAMLGVYDVELIDD